MTKHDNTHQDERVELYEIGYLVVPTVAEEQLPGVVAELHKTLEANGAEITLEGSPVMRDLAYEIAKASVGKRERFNSAYFGFIVFKASTKTAPDLKKAFDATDKILRYILVKTDEETANTPRALPEIFEEVKSEETPATVSAEPKVSEEELDKKIDTLVA